MKQILTNNLLLKLVSVAVACIIWLLVANINDPVVVRSYEVPVTVQNSAYLESDGKTYRVLEDQQMVTVILKGKSSVADKRQDDIRATADLTQIVNMDTTPVMVPVSAVCEGVPVEDVTVVPGLIAIELEDMVSKDFTVTVTAGETTSSSDFEVGSMKSSPEKVTLTGPESLISIIDRVAAEVDTSTLREDTIETCRLKVYDKNQNALSNIQMGYLKFNIGEPVVDVHFDLWDIRDEVKLKVNYSGEPASGYQVNDVTVTPSTISVAGTDQALAQLAADGNVIEIPEDAVVVDGQNNDYEVRLDLSEYMPADIIAANNAQAAIVNVSIIPTGSKQYRVATKNIKIRDLDKKLRLVFDTDRLSVRVRGNGGDLEALKASDIEMSVDMENKSAGAYEVEVDVSLPDGYELLEKVKALVQVSELE